jgi:acetyl-CoA carboxylase biotin carboxylase subunit
MNTRLQVEHPITEMITGIDLVRAQIRVARGEPLPWSQSEITARGHAIECRIYAEDPAQGFRPAPGKLAGYREPGGPFVRVDAGYAEGDEVPVHYDPQIAKLIVWGATRDEAISRTRRALQDYAVVGIPTSIPFFLALLEDPAFLAGDYNTSFLAGDWRTTHLQVEPPAAELPFVAAAIAAFEADRAHSAPAQTAQADAWQRHARWKSVLRRPL